MTLRLESTVGARGQTVIPKPIRDQMKLQPGDRVLFHLEGDRIVIEPADRTSALEAFINAIPKRPMADYDADAVYDEEMEERFRKSGLSWR